MTGIARDHGGGLDAAVREFGGTRADWLDLSTGINPLPYPLPDLPSTDWTALPDAGAMADLLTAARAFWSVPTGADILAAPGASALIARLPWLCGQGGVQIENRTYNEHAAAFRAAGWQVSERPEATRVIVHPNNPDGKLWPGASSAENLLNQLILDESFCDTTPERSHVARATEPGVIILKSFGKFWGLAGARLGFAIGHPDTLAPLRDMVGPWPVAGPTLHIGALALADQDWAKETRARLTKDANRLDALLAAKGIANVGGTSLFRLYDTPDAAAVYHHLARQKILSRVFPYAQNWLRLGLPAGADNWTRLEAALADFS